MTLILGTSSQFRRKLFQESFSDFISKDEKIEQFISPDIDEKASRDSDSEKLCQKIAVAKCDAILKEYEEKLPKDSIILTFDQVVVCDGELREKPVDESEARKFLKSYSEGSNTFSD
jgi:septum formation protein